MDLPWTPDSMDEDDMHLQLASKRRKVQEDEDDDDLDEERLNALLDSYAPLSSLPTPPLSKDPSPFISGNMSLAALPSPPSETMPMPLSTPSTVESRESSASSEPSHSRKWAQYFPKLFRFKRDSKFSPINLSFLDEFIRLSEADSDALAFAACLLANLNTSMRFLRDWQRALDALIPSSQDWRVIVPRRPLMPEVLVLVCIHLARVWLTDWCCTPSFWASIDTSGAVTIPVFDSVMMAVVQCDHYKPASVTEDQLEYHKTSMELYNEHIDIEGPTVRLEAKSASPSGESGSNSE